MIKVGVIGLGMMGLTHLDVYRTREDVNIVAISDINPDRLSGKVRAVGNIEGQAKSPFDYGAVKRYPEGKLLIADPEIDLVDICLPTPLHCEYGIHALQAGKHVMVEKPLSRTANDADRLAAAGEKSKGKIMVGMVMRFWPGWVWLKERIADKTFGNVLSAQFRRVATHPGGAFYLDAEQCGGALLDLHIHDTDFIQWCFGKPASVTSFGYSSVTKGIDHVVTRYEYPNVLLVVAEGSWAMSPGFNFTMQFTVNFDHATAVFDLAAGSPLKVFEKNKAPKLIDLPAGMGYEHEIVYFLECVKRNIKPETVTLPQAALSVRIVEAELESIRSGKSVKL